MIFEQVVGLVSYGTYLPPWSLSLSEIEAAYGKSVGSVSSSLGVEQKTVPSLDEDTATLSIEAAQQALLRAELKLPPSSKKISRKTKKSRAKLDRAHVDRKVDCKFNRSQVKALFIGSESHPYAVKPTGTMVAQALGIGPELAMADLQFACKAGTQALQIVLNYALTGLASRGLAIGADTAQAKPGDALEYTAAAGGAAYLVGCEHLIAKLIGTASVATDTPDFWRRTGEPYPKHGGRFTGQPAYFHHVSLAAKQLLSESDLSPEQIDYCVFHTPNAKFPRKVAKKLGFTRQQLEPSLVVEKIGNTYAGASLLALAAVLDQAKPGQKILVTSYGSGAGADSFLFQTTEEIARFHKLQTQTVQDQIGRLRPIDYQTYYQWLQKRGH